MISLATRPQIEANRENAALSTGPRTEDGKRASSRNGLTHGLSGSGLLLPEAEARRAAEIEAGLRLEFRPVGEAERLLVREIAVATVRAEQARALQIERRAESIERARLDWEADRRLDALETATRLPKDPDRIVAKLLQTKAGARFLIERWAYVRQAAEAPDRWTPEARDHALDLLGLDPAHRNPNILPARIETDAHRANLTALADEEIRRIRIRIETTLEPLDAAARDRAERGCEPAADRHLRLLRRYERDAQRRAAWAWSEFQKIHVTEADVDVTEQSQLTEELADEDFRTDFPDDGEAIEEELEATAPRFGPRPALEPVAGLDRRQRRAAASRRRSRR